MRHNRLLTRAAPYGADSEPRTSESGCAITYDVLFNDAAIGCPIRISILCHSATFVSTILAPGSTQIANQAFSNTVALLAVAQKRPEPGAASRLGLGVYTARNLEEMSFRSGVEVPAGGGDGGVAEGGLY